MKANDVYLRIRQMWKGSIEQLEKQAGLGQGTIGKWKTSFPKIDKLSKVVEVLGCPYDELLANDKKLNNYNTYNMFLGMCQRANVAPEVVFNHLHLPLSILEDWKNGIMPNRFYKETGEQDNIWALANYFEENRVWNRPNPFESPYKIQVELLEWFNKFDIIEQVKFVETIKNSETFEYIKTITALEQKETNG